jgi:hypothetical protein
MCDADRLAEATALLARIVKYAREDRATTPRVTRLARVLAEVELNFLRPLGHGRASAQPAAPEPSAEQMIAHLKSEIRAHRLAHQETSRECEHAEQRTEAVEAQLAAVREIAYGWAHCDSRTVQGYGDAIMDVLSPPSPNAAQEMT